MTGFTDVSEAAILDDATVGLGRNLYARLIRVVSPNNPATVIAAGHNVLKDDATLWSEIEEVTGGGYAPLLVSAAAWGAAVGGAPTTKQVPKSGGPPLAWTASGADFGDIVSYVLTTDANPISSANAVFKGALTDTGGTHISVNIPDGGTIEFTETRPIRASMGDPAAGTVPQ